MLSLFISCLIIGLLGYCFGYMLTRNKNISDCSNAMFEDVESICKFYNCDKKPTKKTNKKTSRKN